MDSSSSDSMNRTTEDIRATSDSARAVPSLPSQLDGRYTVQTELGEGGFGTVRLGYDEKLERAVALKIPRRDRFRNAQELESFTKEAKTIASLQHEGIVSVYDVGVHESTPFIVLEYIRGRSLAHWLVHESTSWLTSARFVKDVAMALAHAHDQGFIHRDIKPSNILLDNDDKVHVTDFGLAIKQSDLNAISEGFAGTIHYMAPEQVRGESHRIDGRTDIWALGVMFYQMLTKRLPFTGSTKRDLSQAILHRDPVPPTELDPSIPSELERICLRCMCRQMTDRYRRATELASDLDSFLRLETGDTDSALTRDRSLVMGSPDTLVVPRGLRSFERDDADFFLRLLPGPRDRDGLPISIRFWKSRIDERDVDETFAIGLLYGPSGCGKSSFVKAGLIPRLQSDVFPLYIDCTPNDTEKKIKQRLAKRYSGLPENGTLDEWLRLLREQPELRSNQKVVIILDQFEQWLATWSSNFDAELLRALRQCDGGNVQCLLMVRDDIGHPFSRLLSMVEVSVVDGFNSMLVDTFDLDHARRVMRELGVAYGRLPEIQSQQTAAQTAFVEQVVAEMTEDNRLYPVRIAVFVEMVKNQPWAPETLASMGGAAGIGVAFLENSVGSKAGLARRMHETQSRNILAALLPETGQIKDCVRTRQELLAASKYESKTREFDELMHLLDVELRLVTPVQSIDSDSCSSTFDKTNPSGVVYQLTHDFLVPSIREWLEREYQSTSRGRAYLLLQQQSATWNQLHSPRYLPTVFEWIVLRLKTNRRDWTVAQRRMMQAAARHVARSVTFWGIVACVFLAVLWSGYQQWKFESDSILARKFKENVLTMRFEDLKSLQSEMHKYRKRLIGEFEDVFRADPDPKRKTRAAIALVPNNPEAIGWLVAQMVSDQTAPADFLLIRDGLRSHSQLACEKLSQVFDRTDFSTKERFRAACALSALSSDSEKVAQARS